jgi:hypothetical protein
MTPFKKGDPRINRNGRPRKSVALSEYLLDKLSAPALDKDGKQIILHGKPQTNLDMITEKMMRDPKQYGELLNRSYGKVKDDIRCEINAPADYDQVKAKFDLLVERKAKELAGH